MLRRNVLNVLVCMLLYAVYSAPAAHAYSIIHASAPPAIENLFAPAAPQFRPASAAPARLEKICKVKPIHKIRPGEALMEPEALGCVLPPPNPRGWEFDAEVIFARTKGKARYMTGTYGYIPNQFDYVDFNADMGLPDHTAIGTFSARFRIRPNWALRYSIMPMAIDGSGSGGRSFAFGNLLAYNVGQQTRVKWERIYQRAGLMYDPIRTRRARVSIFGEYLRLDEKVSVIQVGCCGSTFEHDLNMGMAGVEFERCMKTGRFCDTLSMECRAGVAFLDQAFGSDISTGMKYKIPMGNGRWGYLEGGYRYLTFKKGYSDFKQIDTSIEGGYLKMGFVF
jgi:hypothetical protein